MSHDKGKSLEPLRQAKEGHERELSYLKRDAVLLMANGKNPVELQKSVVVKIQDCENRILSITAEIHNVFATWVSQLRESGERYAVETYGPSRTRLKILCAESAAILAADAAAAKTFRESVVFLHKLREQLAVETREGTVAYPIPGQGEFYTIPEPPRECFDRRDFVAMLKYLSENL